MFTCLLITRLLVIDFSINSCDDFEILLILFFLKLHSFSVFVLISYISTLSCIDWRAYIYHAITCHLPDIILLSCYHLTSSIIYLNLIILTIMGIMTWHLAYILIYFSTNYTPDTPIFLISLACSCSFPKSNNYLINHKKGQLTSGRGKLADINICSCFSGIRYVVQLIFRFDQRASRWPRGAMAPSFLVLSW